ncbi:hypothetical protein QVM19_31795, partial [Pseudomonas aeruginosa]|uniref:hypothetical protein n=1 Tax=Pseudomonas aeruginosa TaxID=287 RepID=UPI00352B63C5
MSPSPSPDERRLVFEARRLTIEALVKIYLEQVSSSRNLVTVYLRLMFTLSLGALAGVITRRRQKLSATPDLSGTVLPLCLIPNS